MPVGTVDTRVISGLPSADSPEVEAEAKVEERHLPVELQDRGRRKPKNSFTLSATATKLIEDLAKESRLPKSQVVERLILMGKDDFRRLYTAKTEIKAEPTSPKTPGKGEQLADAFSRAFVKSGLQGKDPSQSWTSGSG